MDLQPVHVTLSKGRFNFSESLFLSWSSLIAKFKGQSPQWIPHGDSSAFLSIWFSFQHHLAE